MEIGLIGETKVPDSSNSTINLNALDLVLDRLSSLALNPKTKPQDFYQAHSKQISACIDAGTILVSSNDAGQVRLLAKNFNSKLARASLQKIQKLIPQLFGSSENPQRISLDQLDLFASVTQPVNGLQIAYVLVREKEFSDLAGNVFADLVHELASQIESYEKGRVAGKKPESVQQLAQLMQLIQNLAKSPSTKVLAFHLVNDLAKVCGADRVTFTNRSGKILAISGVSQHSKRTELARNLAVLGKFCISSKGTIEWSGDEIVCDGRRRRGLKEVIRKLACESGFAIPLFESNRNQGAVVLEYFEQEVSVEKRELVNEAMRFVTPVVAKSVRFYALPGVKLLDLIFNGILLRPVRSLVCLCMIGILLACVFAILFAWQRPFVVEARGVLSPSEIRNVFAQIEAEVEQLHVTSGANVKAKQLLVVLDADRINNELVVVEGEINESLQQLRGLELWDPSSADSDQTTDRRAEIASEIERYKIKIATLRSRKNFYLQQKNKADVLSPIEGQITTPFLSERINARPLNRGDVIMSIANINGPWEIELMIPENRVEYIREWEKENGRLPEVKFRLASDSDESYNGTLMEIDYRVYEQVEGQEDMVRAKVEIDEKALAEELRIGTRVIARIECGEKTNFFLLTYELQNRIRRWLFY